MLTKAQREVIRKSVDDEPLTDAEKKLIFTLPFEERQLISMRNFAHVQGHT